MFAVPGWSLSPALLKSQDASTVGKNGGEQANKSKKRKRRQGQSDVVEVTNSNVAELWNQHIANPAGHSKGIENSSKVQNQNEAIKPTGKSAKPRTPTVAQALSSATAKKKQNEMNSKQSKPREMPKNSLDTTKSGIETAGGVMHSADQRIPPKPPMPSTKAPVVAGNTMSKLTPLQAAMRQKLISARFRHLNETLYTAPSAETQKLFDTNPSFFDEYHEGFRQQVSTWPENPVDRFVKELQQRGQIKDHRKDRKRPGPLKEAAITDTHSTPLPRTGGTCTVADLGCGDAALANQIATSGKKLHINVLSYDLQSTNPLVTKADISNLPLENGSVNIAIFCLALMGTNWTDFIDEAWRVLHWKGELWIAEIKSRFARATKTRVDHSVGKRRKIQQKGARTEAEDDDVNEKLMVEVDGAESGKELTDVSAFVQVLQKRGFALHGGNAVDLSNKMFVQLKFTKALNPVKGKNVKDALGTAEKPGAKRQKTQFLDDDNEGDAMNEASILKPCLYKIR